MNYIHPQPHHEAQHFIASHGGYPSHGYPSHGYPSHGHQSITPYDNRDEFPEVPAFSPNGAPYPTELGHDGDASQTHTYEDMCRLLAESASHSDALVPYNPFSSHGRGDVPALYRDHDGPPFDRFVSSDIDESDEVEPYALVPYNYHSSHGMGEVPPLHRDHDRPPFGRYVSSDIEESDEVQPSEIMSLREFHPDRYNGHLVPHPHFNYHGNGYGAPHHPTNPYLSHLNPHAAHFRPHYSPNPYPLTIEGQHMNYPGGECCCCCRNR